MAKRSSKISKKAASDSPERAKAAKAQLSERYAQSDWCRGIGIAPGEEGGLALRINVAPGALSEGLNLPKEVDGFPLQVVAIEAYHKRGPSAGGAASEPRKRSPKPPAAGSKSAPKRAAESGAAKGSPAPKSRAKPKPQGSVPAPGKAAERAGPGSAAAGPEKPVSRRGQGAVRKAARSAGERGAKKHT